MRAKTTKRGMGWALQMFESLSPEVRQCWAEPGEKPVALLMGDMSCPTVAARAAQLGLTATKACTRLVEVMPVRAYSAFFREHAPRTLPVARGYLAAGCSVAILVNPEGLCELLFSKNRTAVLGAVFALKTPGGEA